MGLNLVADAAGNLSLNHVIAGHDAADMLIGLLLARRYRALNRTVVVLGILVLVSGCARATPAGFWFTYRTDLINQKFSDQGPWGGMRWVLWESKTVGTFQAAQVLDFAKSKGWSCGNPVQYSVDQMRLWQYGGQLVFPLHFGPGDRRPDDRAVLKFPRQITSDSLVYECKTGWIRVDPGSGNETDAFGYIQIEQSGRRMAVYHLWGE